MKKLLLAVAVLPMICSCGNTNKPYLDKVKSYYYVDGRSIVRENYEYLGCDIKVEYEHYYYFVDIVRKSESYIEHFMHDMTLTVDPKTLKVSYQVSQH